MLPTEVLYTCSWFKILLQQYYNVSKIQLFSYEQINEFELLIKNDQKAKRL